jgi:hypothetical protein
MTHTNDAKRDMNMKYEVEPPTLVEHRKKVSFLPAIQYPEAIWILDLMFGT